MKSRKNILTILIIIIFVLMLLTTSCTKDETQNKIKIGLMSDTAAIPLIVAQELGYFGNYDIQITIDVFLSALDRDSALQANELNCVSTDLISVGLFKESQDTFVVTSQTECQYRLLSSPNSGISSTEELDNSMLGLSTNTLMEFLTDSTIDMYNLTGIEKVNIPKIPNRLEMLKNDQIDAAFLPEPLASLAEVNGSHAVSSNIDINLYPGVLLFNKDFVNNNEAIVEKFYSAYNDAVDYINKNGTTDLSNQLNEKLRFPEEVKGMLDDIQFSYAKLPSNADVVSVMTWLYNKELITEIYTFEDLTYDIK